MDQALALNLLKSGFNCMLSGQAGTGKSYTLKKYIEYLKRKRINYAITASTGIAASHLGGQTIHSWSGIGVSEELSIKKLEEIKEKKKYIQTTATLILDEISMLHAKQWILLDAVLKFCRENDNPFGGIQIIVCGDFFQLPPVEAGSSTGNAKFCFMTSTWVEADFKICYLTKQYRQGGDILSTILNEIREGNVSLESKELLEGTKLNQLEQSNLTRLYTHNIDVDKINEEKLQTLNTKLYSRIVEKTGVNSLSEMLIRQNRIPEQFNYKIGALVMFIKNHSEQVYSNGTCGVIVDVVNNDEHGLLPVVKINNGEEIVVEPDSWKFLDEGGDELAQVTTLPIRLAWAITVHKSQGMTLDAAEMDLSGTFETGMGYVALSRLRTLAGMRILGINDLAYEISPIVRKVDKRFRELSNELEVKSKQMDFKKLHSDFYKLILENGWTFKNEYKKSNYKRYPTKGLIANKNSKETLVQLNGGIDLEKLAKDQKLSYATIIRHIQTAKANEPDLDISYLKPSPEVLACVSRALKEYALLNRNIHFFKTSSVFIMNLIGKHGGKDIPEHEVWKASLFLNATGEYK